MQNLSFFGLLFFVFFIIACQSNHKPESADKAHVEAIENWRKTRIKNLTSANGWLSLAGLFWLEQGENTFGSGNENGIVFPAKAPERMGSFHLAENSVFVKILPGIEVTVNDSVISEMRIIPDSEGSPTILTYESLNWNAIKRGERTGIRLRDTLNEARQNFEGIEYFPIDKKWKIAAIFEPYEGGREMKFKNVLDMEVNQKVEGALKFEIGEATYGLDVLGGGDDSFFLIFADATSGENTYGGGRYLYVPRPAPETDQTEIDFNKAYTPPCGFTDYATCLLPPPQNRLPVAVEAGEQYRGHH